MKSVFYRIFLFLVILEIGNGCNGHRENKQLKDLDILLKNNAQMTLEQLNGIDPAHLNHPDRYYYYLLKASATDRSYIRLTNEDALLRQSEKHYAKVKDYYNLVRTEYYIAKCLKNRDSIQAAHSMLRKAMEHFEKTDQSDPNLGGLIYYQLGTTESSPEDIATSKTYFEKSQEMFIKAQDTVNAIYAMAQVVRIESVQGNLTKANDLANIILLRIDSLQHIPEKQFADVRNHAFYIISELYLKGTDIFKALAFNKTTINIYQQANHRVPVSLYHNMAYLFRQLHRPDSAKYYYNLAIDTTSMPQSSYFLANIYWELATIEGELGNDKAADSLKNKYNATIRIWYEDHANHSLQVLERNYDRNIQKQLILKERYAKLTILGAGICLLLIALIIFLLFFRKHRKLEGRLEKLSDEVRHTKWGFSIMKELISSINIIYDEINQILAKNRTPIKDPVLYRQLHDMFLDQRQEYTLQLFNLLTNADEDFINKLQKLFPDITPDELTLAAMVRFRWSIADISIVFQISEDSGRKRRSRLKNKILSKNASIEDMEDYLWELTEEKEIKIFKKENLFEKEKEQEDDSLEN